MGTLVFVLLIIAFAGGLLAGQTPIGAKVAGWLSAAIAFTVAAVPGLVGGLF